MQDFDKNQLAHIQQFKDKLVDGVSKDDVLALENFVGSPIITEKHKLNRFTNLRSNTLCEEVTEVVEDILVSNPLNAENAYSDLTEIIFDTRSKLWKVKDYLTLFNNVDRELMNLFMDERFVNRYEGDHVIHNIVEKDDVFKAMSLHGEYLNSVLNAYSDTDKEHINNFLNVANEAKSEISKTAELEILSLLRVLTTGQLSSAFFSFSDLDLDKTTVSDIYKFWSTDLVNVLKTINNILHEISCDLLYLRDRPDNYSTSSQTSFRDMFRRYKHFNGVIQDDVSLYILRIFSRLVYVKKYS